MQESSDFIIQLEEKLSEVRAARIVALAQANEERAQRAEKSKNIQKLRPYTY